MAGGLKFWNKEVEGLYYPCSENKDADQLRDYRAADLRLCFRICKSRFSHDEAQIMYTPVNPRFANYIKMVILGTNEHRRVNDDC